MTPDPAPEQQAEAEARAPIDLVRARLPLDVTVHGPPDAWPLVGPALISRATGTLEAIFALHPLDREADANTLLRSLYEHVTTFAWLAADPGEERMRRWLKSDCRARLRMDDDCKKVGVPILDPDKRNEFETTVAALPNEMPDLLARAEAADNYWTGKITGLLGADTAMSFRGLYAFAYRRYSAIAHPSNLGLNPVTASLDGGRTRVEIETRRPDMRGPFGLARAIYALGLYIAAVTLAWPTKGDIDTALSD